MGTKQSQTRQGKTQAKGSRTTQRPDTAKVSGTPSVSVCDDLQARIATRAHELYVNRGGGDGYDLNDWIQAEREVLSQVPQV
ncbi:MAG: DUF2934 domain-containing protein [Nitrospirales bacterium]